MEINASLTSHLAKPLKYYVNNMYRKKVKPERGSIIFSDFGLSGVYVGNDEIVAMNGYKTLDGKREIRKLALKDFLRENKFLDSLYVSSDFKGAVENNEVALAAEGYIGEKNDFGLIFKDNNDFIKKCLDSSKNNFFETGEDLEERFRSDTGAMKQKVKNKIGGIKWLLWDFEEDFEIYSEKKIEEKGLKSYRDITEEERESLKSLNIGKIIKEYEEIPLNDEIIIHLYKELNEMTDFFREVQDEKLPDPVMKVVIKIIKVLEEVIFSYEQNENSIKGIGGDFSYKEIRETGDDFKKIVDEMIRNKHIQEVLKKLGKGKAERKRKDKNKVAGINKNEVFGIHKSNDLYRLLPSELRNLENEDLKYLFYSRYLENSLLTYEIKGNSITEKNESKENMSRRGPIVVCLDTSGSMKGSPLIRAKALVMAIVKILKQEKRELHVIIFGAKDQYAEISVSDEKDILEIIKFLKKSYDGGTDFETPLRRAIDIISLKKEYKKSDILMVTDGACKITHTFRKKIIEEKKKMDFKIYTVICEADRVEKDFSDKVIVI